MVDSRFAGRTVVAGAVLLALGMSPLAAGISAAAVPSIAAGGPPGVVEPVPPPPAPNAVPAPPPPPAAPAATAPPRCGGTDLFTGIPIPLGCVP